MRIILTLSLLLSLVAVAEDIELFIGEVSQRMGNRPQVLIIFDNSSSMDASMEVKEPYDPNTTYPAVGGYNSLQERFIYFTKGPVVDDQIPIPDNPNETRRFLDDINSCDTARNILLTQGFYTGYVREYKFQGQAGSWQEIPENNGANIEILDCWDDILQENPNNPGILHTNQGDETLPSGYPVDGKGTKQNPEYYSSDLADSNTSFGFGETVTLYTDNYLRWYKSESIDTVSLDRLTVAKSAINMLIKSTPSVDFGLEIFNYNFPSEGERDGGRIVAAIEPNTSSRQDELVSIIDAIQAKTNTPLCESLYEASLYFGGKAVDFGNDDSDHDDYDGNIPALTDDALNAAGDTYLPPQSGCASESYVILITDGSPTLDHSADAKIDALKAAANPSLTAVPYPTANPDGGASSSLLNNRLSILAEWMATNDIDPLRNGDQHVKTFTVGFSGINEETGGLLQQAADFGGGKYYFAQDAQQLSSSLQSALFEILKVNSSFTSPAVASDNFDRMQTLNSVYYTMFLPEQGPRWAGNLKKLEVKNNQQVDQTGAVAVDEVGNIDADAKTFWSSEVDGNEVKKGGALEHMIARTTSRNIYSNIGTGGALASFSRSNMESFYGSSANLALALDITEETIDDYLNFAIGKDVDDDNANNKTNDNRDDILGDPLHSRPLVINYGGTKDSQDVRIILGTNTGMLHMFNDKESSVEESWAFMPHEFFSNIKPLRENIANSDKIYGIDGSAKMYYLDANGDGSITTGGSDKVWIFFGLRRGGQSYYALDITDPDRPSLKWHIDSSTTGFSRLGQTWSTPAVTHIKMPQTGAIKPVIIVGGGFSTNKDIVGVGSADTVGNAIYIIDADTGELVWSASQDSTIGKNLQVSNLSDGIASPVAIMDSDSDGLTDRLYAADTGGNIWRVDMPGNEPFDSDFPWTVHKLASLGGDTLATDRRFYSSVSIARSIFTQTTAIVEEDEEGNNVTNYYNEDLPFDAILIGSGNRVYPTETDTEDMLFMIRDQNIVTKSFKTDVPTAFSLSNLKDLSTNPFQTYVDAESLTEEQLTQLNKLNQELSSADGWYVRLTNTGEKTLASPTVVAGVAYYPTFTPHDFTSTCSIESGGGLLYGLDLQMGTTIYNWRALDIGEQVPDTPVAMIPLNKDEDDPSKVIFVGVGEGEGGGVLTLCPAGGNCTPCVGENCDQQDVINLQTMRTYVVVDETNN